MKFLIYLFFTIILNTFCYGALLTPKYVPHDVTSGPPPQVENGSIVDFGTASGMGDVGIGTSDPTVAGFQLVVEDPNFTGAAIYGLASSGDEGVEGDGIGDGGIGLDGESGDGNNSVGVIANGNGASGSIGLWATGANTNGIAVKTEVLGSGDYGIYEKNSSLSPGMNYFQDNVGIGTLTPQASLDILGSFKLRGNGVGSGYVLTSNSVGVGTWMPPTGGDGGSGSVTSVTLATPNSTLSLSGTNPVTSTGTINADINLANNNTWTGQQIFNSSNVGIGTAHPGQALDVTGTIRALSVLTTSGGTSYTTGNLGVGTVNPGQQLDVNGTGRMTQLDVEGTLAIIHNTSGGGCTAITASSGNSLTGIPFTCP